MDQRSIFITQVRLQFDQLFQAKKAGQNVLVLKHRAEGFFYAGELLGLVDKALLQQLMEQSYLEVFGVALSKTSSYQTERKQALENEFYQYFEEPAFNRLRS
ncbi:MAG: hypothetical protein KJ556_16290 [Gammaproteobacteria bacterium]|nr:hypothetical protein [Gammaproteobacteria bacterium]MBU2057891.1 hypothetical protein [Gammaproteobacteria bacterium]MBU2176674.1 hypothetical protein [Gammaproteobacteria bacterium]MBU2247807.1 hypothetical protein [Gammaproteobacteria bacterium]MBU2344332.1 hypothetical protein [Gammaproteobacteria bacterium]